MGIFSWVALGLVAGVLAKFVMPGRDGGGWVATILLGVAGAFIGGYAGTFFGLGSVNGFNLTSVGLATGGAVVALVAYRLIRR